MMQCVMPEGSSCAWVLYLGWAPHASALSPLLCVIHMNDPDVNAVDSPIGGVEVSVEGSRYTRCDLGVLGE